MPLIDCYVLSTSISKKWRKNNFNNQIHKFALKNKLKQISGFSNKWAFGNKGGFSHNGGFGVKMDSRIKENSVIKVDLLIKVNSLIKMNSLTQVYSGIKYILF